MAPEAVIARAFALNGLDGERARLTREALLRNLARADAWELFAPRGQRPCPGRRQPAPIPAGIHRGHLAETAIVFRAGLGPQSQREFACLVLRADDDLPRAVPAPPSKRRGAPARQPGDMLAHHNPPRRPAATPAPAVALVPMVYDDALPVAYTVAGSDSGGSINVRVAAHPGQPVDLSDYGGPAVRFLLRGADAGGVRFALLDGKGLSANASEHTATVDSAQKPDRPIYEQAGVMRISLCGPPASVSGDGTRTFLFEFPAHAPARPH